MNLKDIQELLEILKDTDVTELELEKAGMKIKLKKGTPAARGGQAGYEALPVEQPARGQQHQGAAPQPGLPAQAAKDEPLVAEGNVVVTSPIVGTFYRSPSPESPVYVEVGDIVKKGQILCIIEAMKLMNEIEAEVSGRIVAILTENTQPVEFGQPLFHIEPA